jgi:hypothetical protein
MIVDREGMATEFLASLHAEGRRVVMILQTRKSRDLTSFSDVGTFVPLSTDTHGQVIREVAPAHINLPREDHPDEPLCLQVALIRDLRRTVSVRPDPEEAEVSPRWDSDLPLEERTWWREGWQAIAAPAKETTAKLIPIVTTEKTKDIDAIELAQTYIHRWPGKTKCHQRLSFASGIGHQPRVCQSGGGKFGGGETTNPLGATARQAQAMGTECGQTRGPGQPTTRAAPYYLQRTKSRIVP